VHLLVYYTIWGGGEVTSLLTQDFRFSLQCCWGFKPSSSTAYCWIRIRHVTMFHWNIGNPEWRQDQLDATNVDLLTIRSSSTCFGRLYAHRQESRQLVAANGVISWLQLSGSGKLGSEMCALLRGSCALLRGSCALLRGSCALLIGSCALLRGSS
jgi:hypothetical protein